MRCVYHVSVGQSTRKGEQSGDSIQQLTSSMRQMHTLALLSRDLYRKGSFQSFQTFQPFNRFASFKALRRFKSSRFKTSRNKQLDRNFQVSGTDGSVTVAVTCIGFSRPRNAWVCLSSIIRLTSNHVHLLVNDTGSDVIAQSMQLIAGRTAQEYIQRKGRQGAF